MSNSNYDLIVIGSGPAGQKAAIRSAKAGLRVAVCEQGREIGGACVHHGTIPSKALRERAVERDKVIRRIVESHPDDFSLSGGVAGLIGEMTGIIHANDRFLTEQLNRNGIDVFHGRAQFVDAHRISVRARDGHTQELAANNIVVATGSKPRKPDHVAIDHEHIFDSDSILSLSYLPQSMAVLGGGVIACEYASIFALLGVKVTLIDRYPAPLGFLDADLTSRFLDDFRSRGSQFIGEVDVADVAFDGVSQVEVRFADERIMSFDKVLCALGRVSLVAGLNLAAAGVKVNERDLVEVDDAGRTSMPHIFAAGDVVGPPSLASASMEQGRRVACEIIGVDSGQSVEWLPTGIYSVPEMASVGQTEKQAREAGVDCVVGYAHFNEIARGHIADASDGMLKMVVGPDRLLLGVHIVGAYATDLVHIGQMGLIHQATIDTYIENVFNFPTYAESYRVAALDAANALRLTLAERNVS